MQTPTLLNCKNDQLLLNHNLKISRLLLSEEIVESRYILLIQMKSYLNIDLYASREVTLGQSWARRLFTLQWKQEREKSYFSLILDWMLFPRKSILDVFGNKSTPIIPNLWSHIYPFLSIKFEFLLPSVLSANDHAISFKKISMNLKI